MKNKYAHVILIFFLLLFSKSFSQEIEIKGTVSDESGALPGASVIIKGTNNGTTTDFEGQFSLRVDPNLQNVLVVSFVGYRTKEVAISADQQNYEILLEIPQ